MQPYRLTVDKFIDHAARWAADTEVVEASAGRVVRRTTYAGLRERANRMSSALAALGIGPGDRVATLAWNTQDHLELYYAVMAPGSVCHTLNPRLAAHHLAAQIKASAARVLAVAPDLVERVAEIASACPSLTDIIVLDAPFDGEVAGLRCWTYEALLADKGGPARWGDFAEETPAGLCFTSGTTGAPRGVVYTHRSNYLHTLRALQADAVALTARDTLLLAVPMFHANGWGMPFAAPAVGARLLLPGRQTDGASLTRLMRDERATLAVGVQTVWLGVVDHLDATGGDLPDLARVLIGGSTCPAALVERLGTRLGARIQTSWGMTELSPTGTIAPPAGPVVAGSSGRAPIGIDLLLTDAEGVALPDQRGPEGHLRVRGASVVDRYFDEETRATDTDGWFPTGDLATIAADGSLTITGRAKDLIKSGGEWINPSEIEAIAAQSSDVALAAVIGRADAKWGERPLLVVEPRPGRTIDPVELRTALRGKVADWWLPDRIVVAPLPLAASGKIDKNRLRADYGSDDSEGTAR